MLHSDVYFFKLYLQFILYESQNFLVFIIMLNLQALIHQMVVQNLFGCGGGIPGIEI